MGWGLRVDTESRGSRAIGLENKVGIDADVFSAQGQHGNALDDKSFIYETMKPSVGERRKAKRKRLIVIRDMGGGTSWDKDVNELLQNVMHEHKTYD